MTITDAMIEAAARAIYEAHDRQIFGGRQEWDELIPEDRFAYWPIATAALEAAERAAWRPIEEAPRDGSRWIAMSPYYGVQIVTWDADQGKWKSVNTDEWFSNAAFTICRPLPTPGEQG